MTYVYNPFYGVRFDTVFDESESYPWESVTRIFQIPEDPESEEWLFQQQFFYDLGYTITEKNRGYAVFSPEYMFEREITDASDVFDFKNMTINYATDDFTLNFGALASGEARVAKIDTIYDNGQRNLNYYQNTDASLSLQILLDQSDDGSLHTWQFITQGYDEGGAIWRSVINDDERVFTKILDDNSGARIKTHDIADDGVSDTFIFNDGIREARIQHDSASNAKPWETVATTYEDNGDVEKRFVVYDDGKTKEKTFADGLTISQKWVDASGNNEWTTIESTYYRDGTEATRTTAYTDGRLREDTFFHPGEVEAGFGPGIRSTYFADPLDNFDWENIEIEYDSDGNMSWRWIFEDGGAYRETGFYSDGTISYSARTDRSATESDEILSSEIRYDTGGTIENQVIMYGSWSNRQTVISLYDEGELESRGFFDENDSKPWFARIIDYGADGPEETLYYAESLVPTAYIDLL